ncbi:phage baseplate assembly protein V [Streptomyces longisporoflavus]|uniref:Phage baseplate assembly protein V n=1 Tax=Streptomyces longisporoflavus TaxID=28044 RepID=A0ABW7QFX2_9ACTN
MTERFHGRYIGEVIDNEDPKNLCRVRLRVPEVLGDAESGWCLPSSPFAGPGVGFAAVPPVKGLVFVEWPAGDVSRVPVWSGAVWSDGNGVPGAGPNAVLLITPGGHKVELIDEPSGDRALRLTAASGAVIRMDASGITAEFKKQKIEVTSSKISFNGGSLEVS